MGEDDVAKMPLHPMLSHTSNFFRLTFLPDSNLSHAGQEAGILSLEPLTICEYPDFQHSI